MLELYENLAARLQRLEPYLAAAAVALFLAVAVAGFQQAAGRPFQILQLAMLWVVGLAVVSRLFHRDIPVAGGAPALSKVRTWRPFLRDISPHLMTSWFLLLIVATVSTLAA